MGVTRRLQRGWLRRLHRGVYAVGALESPLTAPAAALLALGPGAVLSHRTAAVIWGLLPARPETPSRSPSSAPIADPAPASRSTTPGPSTPAKRKASASPHPPARCATSPPPARTSSAALIEAQVLLLVSHGELNDARRHRGARALRAALDNDPGLTRSEAERRLLRLIRAADLPAPLTNVRVAGHEVDVHWPAHGLVVEFDGWAYHSTRAAFERDRRRDADLLVAGRRVIRVTHRQLSGAPEELIARLAAALATAR